MERSGDEPYKLFRIRKRRLPSDTHQRYRIISVPDDRLMALQRWINSEILQKLKPHSSSTAFSPGSDIVKAARQHCQCRWLIKMDVVNFFESISEQQVFHVFSSVGYQPLVAFQLARLCTRRGQHSWSRRAPRWRSNPNKSGAIPSYYSHRLGHLPQGAPTSPLLSNLVMRQFDKRMSKLALNRGLVYSRYADDLALSSDDEGFSRASALSVISTVKSILREHGFRAHHTKTKIIPPGSRRIVLGLLVDGDEPRLTKAYRRNLNQHLYFMSIDSVGPVAHAEHKNFTSVYGLRNHVEGLIAHAAQVDAPYAKLAWDKFNAVKWP